VEDNPADVRLMQEALNESGVAHELHTTLDGEEALDFLYGRDPHAGKPRPDLILLDINLPKVNGHKVLGIVKNEPKLRQIPVVMLTSSDSLADIRAAYDSHANAYVRKPSEIGEYFNVVSQMKKYWTEIVALPTSGI
jgi:two-component system, chemotaxis family, response regulator Rcp1